MNKGYDAEVTVKFRISYFCNQEDLDKLKNENSKSDFENFKDMVIEDIVDNGLSGMVDDYYEVLEVKMTESK